MIWDTRYISSRGKIKAYIPTNPICGCTQPRIDLFEVFELILRVTKSDRILYVYICKVVSYSYTHIYE